MTDFWSYGRSFTSIPKHNLYVPTQTTVMPKPTAWDSIEQIGYTYQENRHSPAKYLQPVKAVQSPNHDIEENVVKPYPLKRPEIHGRRIVMLKKLRAPSRRRLKTFGELNLTRKFSTMPYTPIRFFSQIGIMSMQRKD